MNTGSRSWLRERDVQWSNRGRKWRKRHREWWKKSIRLLSSFHNINTRTGHSKQQPNNCSYYIWPGFVLPATLLSSPLWDIFFSPSAILGNFVCLLLFVSSGFLFVLDWTQHKESSLLFIFELLWLFLLCARWKKKQNVFSVSIYNTWIILSRKILDKEFCSFLVLLFCLPPVVLHQWLVSVL